MICGALIFNGFLPLFYVSGSAQLSFFHLVEVPGFQCDTHGADGAEFDSHRLHPVQVGGGSIKESMVKSTVRQPVMVVHGLGKYFTDGIIDARILLPVRADGKKTFGEHGGSPVDGILFKEDCFQSHLSSSGSRCTSAAPGAENDDIRLNGLFHLLHQALRGFYSRTAPF